jgi:TetR/AcrR family transcriptional repressor of bet genes
MRAARRAELTAAFAEVLAEHGYAGATIAAVAARAGVAPGLVHHHFDGKEDLLESLLDELMARFRRRTRARETGMDPLEAYVAAALALDHTADRVAARCWVGLFAEAVRDPALFERVRRLVDTEIEAIERRGAGRLATQDAGAVLAFVIGALVLGAFAPRKTAGFAAPSLRTLVEALARARRGRSTG